VCLTSGTIPSQKDTQVAPRGAHSWAFMLISGQHQPPADLWGGPVL
jgi:hypothetical protein